MKFTNTALVAALSMLAFAAPACDKKEEAKKDDNQADAKKDEAAEEKKDEAK